MKNLIIIVGLLFTRGLMAQAVTGLVTNQQNEPLEGASVVWLGTDAGVTTNKKGIFTIRPTSNKEQKLVASFSGYISDTITYAGQQQLVFILYENLQSQGNVLVRGLQSGILLSDRRAIKTEQITKAELTKAACCDLAGCFETQATVQPQTTNIITNSKELRILGLSGVYNQVLIDGLPMVQGLTYTYGISSLPGTLVNNIHIAKGANSVLQGYESISGQINVETRDGAKGEKLLVNGYMNSFLEKHLNVNFSFGKGKWNNLTSFHTVQPANKTDRDKDNFLDLPLLTRYMVFNKWKYGKETDWGWNSTVTLRYLDEKRVGGQPNFNHETDKGSAAVYGQTVAVKQPELMAALNYRFNDNHQLSLQTSAFHQQQESFFGTLAYKAKQNSFYANVQYNLTYGHHQSLKTGFSFRHLLLDETIGFTENSLQRTYNGQYNRLENIPGLFAENTLHLLNDKLTWMAGVRLDHHNQFGSRFTPRTLLKYDLSAKTIIRASAGTGWRTVNFFSENVGLLASSRNVEFAEALQPEKAINSGLNLTHKFESNGGLFSGYISADFYHTLFSNQIFPDYDTDPTKAIVKNFTGKSVSNGFQADAFVNIWKRFELKAGYNYLDVYRQTEKGREQLPFNAKHKLLTTLGYKPLSGRFHADFVMHWFGEQRLPNTQSNPPEYQRPGFSEPYSVLNGQFTYNFPGIELYGGCENIFDFRQSQPIISWQDPFGPYFDTSSVWGPTRGREFYLGFRIKVNKN